MAINFLYYNGFGHENILPEIRRAVPDWQVINFSSLADFLKHIGHPLVSSQNIALLCLANPDELDQIVRHRVLLQDMDFILILPEVNEEMANKTSLLSPRLTFFEEPDSETICNVLKKLHLSRMQRKAAWARRLP